MKDGDDFEGRRAACDYEVWERENAGDRSFFEDEEDVEDGAPFNIGLEIESLNKALQFYSSDDNSEERISLLRRLDTLHAQYDKIAGLDEEGRRKWQEKKRLTNLVNYGCESIEDRLAEYRETVITEAKFSRAEREVLNLTFQCKTQAEIAQKLKKTQQAVSKALVSAQEKYALGQRVIGGPHSRGGVQLMHYSDTRALSEWGKNYLQEHGKMPERCRHCPKVEIPRTQISQETEITEPAPEKLCKRCNSHVGAFRESCPYCGGELIVARKEKRQSKSDVI